MLTFDHRDFTRSAWSLAGGMLGVALVAAIRSSGDIPTMSLTLGLPLGVLAFWALYSLRMRRMAQDLGFVRNDPPLFKPQRRTPASFKPKLLHRASSAQLTLEAARHLPRFRVKTRVASLSWDSSDAAQGRDQWYM